MTTSEDEESVDSGMLLTMLTNAYGVVGMLMDKAGMDEVTFDPDEVRTAPDLQVSVNEDGTRTLRVVR